jgi:rod shape-determining protein MreD
MIPDLLLIIVIYSGLFEGSRSGLLTGFLLGMIQDLLLGGMFGVFTITKTLLGGLAGLLKNKVYKRNFIVPPLFVFVYSLIQEYLVLLLSQDLLFKVNFLKVFKSSIFPLASYNAILGIVIYFILYYLTYNGSTYYE